MYSDRLNQKRGYEALTGLSELAAELAGSLPKIVNKAAVLLAESLEHSGKVLACGNGGSAADAQHFVAEFIGRLHKDRPSLAAISLTTDPSIMTALGNDYGFDQVFARQVEGLGKEGDVLLGISTSGRSANVLEAFKTARKLSIKTIALVGQSSDPVLTDADICIHIPTANTQRVQELHMVVLHMMCDSTERLLFSEL